MINSQAANGRGRRGATFQQGRGRESSSGRGMSFRPPSGNRVPDRQQGSGTSIDQPEQQALEDTYPPGFLKQHQRPLQGFVVALLDSYGFIRVPGDQQQIFFHGSEVQNSSNIPDEQFNMQHLLQLGDEVSFDMKHIVHKEKKVNAVNIRKLEAGTIAALQAASRGRYRGIIKTVPGESSWRSSDVTPGVVAFTKPSAGPDTPAEQQASYKPGDLHEPNLKLRVGDKVEFSLTTVEADQKGQDQASDIALVARAASVAANDGPQHGCIVAVNGSFGFIRPAGRATERIYFRAGEVIGVQPASLPLNAEVSYIMAPDPRGRQDMAAKIHILPQSFDAEQLKDSKRKFHGRVAKLAKAPAEGKLQDGLITFTEGQTTLFCSYGHFQVDGSAQLELEDEVTFTGGVVALTGAYKATSVGFLMTAADRSNQRELGQIKNMKKEFGFISCCERLADMFFHHSALEGSSDDFAVGQDVSFKVVKEPNGERPNAVEIQKAPKGTAVFEEVSQEQHTGTVVDRVVPPTRGYNPAGESGLVAYETADSKKQQLPFGLADLQDDTISPAAGDKVTFKIATHLAAAKAAATSAAPNKKYAGKRAVQVAMVPQQGLLVSIAGSAGVVEFIQDQTYDQQSRSDKQCIPFQLPEGQESALKPSDIVSFVVCTGTRSKEKRAVGITLVKKGDGVVPEESTAKNPNAMKFTGVAAEGASKPRPSQAVRIARGPDGTRGFTAALQPGNRARLLPPPPTPADLPARPSADGQEPSAKPVRNTAATPSSRSSADGSSESTPGQASSREYGRQQGGKGQGYARTPPVSKTPSSAPRRPTAILQPPPRQQSSSPVPRHQRPSPAAQSHNASPLLQSANPDSAQVADAPRTQQSVDGSFSRGAQPRTAQNGVASQGRRQRQPRGANTAQDLHRQAVHARADQAVQQQLQSATQPSQSISQPVDVSVLRVQQSNVMAAPAAGFASSGGPNGESQAVQKAPIGSTDSTSDLQRTASGKLRATAAPFVPRSVSGSPLSTSSS